MGLIKKTIHYKSVLKLGVPVVMAQIGQITVGLADNMMIGHIGPVELAAASLANNIFVMAILFGVGFSYVLTPLVGEAFGQNNRGKIRYLFAGGFMANAIIGAALTLVLIIISFFMNSMGQPAEVVPLARQYLLILVVSVIPMLCFFTFKQLAEGVGNTIFSMTVMIMGNLVNILFNYLLIYGRFGFPALGLAGAAIGTLIARVFMLVAAVLYFCQSREFKSYLPSKKIMTTVVKRLKLFFRLGIPSGGQMVMESSAFALSTVMMGWIGARGLAAHQIAMSLSTLGFMVYQGIGAATTIRVSHLKGAGDWRGVKDLVGASRHILLLMVLVAACFFGGLNEFLPSLYTSDKELIELASGFLIVLAIYQIPDSLMLLYSFTLRGLADIRVPALITFMSLFIVSLSVSYLSAFKMQFGEIGIWFGFPVGLSCGAVLLILRFNKLLKKQENRF